MALRDSATVTTVSSDSHSKTATQEKIAPDLAARISKQVPSWSLDRLANCTITRNRGSSFPDCKAEIEIFDGAGANVIHGREFNDHRSFYWDA